MLLDLIRTQKESIEAMAERYGARRVRIFGSVARGEEGRLSDVDFLVDLPIGYDMFKQRLPFKDDLELLLNRRVELVPEHELNRHIRDQVLREAVEL